MLKISIHNEPLSFRSTAHDQLNALDISENNIDENALQALKDALTTTEISW